MKFGYRNSRSGFDRRGRANTIAVLGTPARLLLAWVFAIACHAQSAGGPQLDDLLAGMDKSAAGFRSMAADLEYTKVTVIVNDRFTQNGRILFDKSGGKTRVMLAFAKPAEKYILFASGKVSLYQPRIAEVDEYELSQRQDLVEQFLLLGFGTPGAELRKAYDVSVKGSEAIAGQDSYLLDLVPKSPKLAAQLQRVQLWISPQNWEPVQQKFYEAGGDYVIARYSSMKLNTKIPDKEFRLPLKGKVKTVRPQAP